MEYAGIGIVPLLIGLLEVFKRLGLNERYIPIFSVILGIGLGGVSLFSEGDILTGIVQGTFIGLSAVGLYSGTKNTLEK